MGKGLETLEIIGKNYALAGAIQKLINANGYADIYVYCNKEDILMKNIQKTGYIYHVGIFAKRLKRNFHNEEYPILNGKVVFKFRCYKVEEIKSGYYVDRFILNKSCLNHREMSSYLKGKNGYAIHISDLEIFDRPRELSEFKHAFVGCKKYCDNNFIPSFCRLYCSHNKDDERLNVFCDRNDKWEEPLTKAPQNMVYVEVEK